MIGQDPLLGRVIDKRYRVLEIIGRGGMGAVYKVEHVKMGKIMAMKVLHSDSASQKDMVRRFNREASAVSRLSHMHSVSVFDFGSDGDLMFLAMEFIDGADLASYLHMEGQLPLSRTTRLLIQVCSALVEAHEKGVVHRDLKPENMVLVRTPDKTDFVKVLDFGLASLRDLNERTRITAQGALVGTPYYMSPEYCRGEPVDARSDIYALGAVMHKLLTGEAPFSAPSPMGIITKHLTAPMVPPSTRYPNLSIPEIADEVVLRAMSKDPAARYQSAAQMRTALADILEIEEPGNEYRRYTSRYDASPSDLPAISRPPLALLQDPVAVRKRGQTPTAPDPPEPPRTISQPPAPAFAPPKKERNKTAIALVVVAAAVLIALAVAGLAMINQLQGKSDMAREREPNDDIRQATPVILGQRLISVLSTPSDRDWYCLGPAPGTHTVQVSGTIDIDTVLVLSNGRTGEQVLVDVLGQGQGEAAYLPWSLDTVCVEVHAKPGAGQATMAIYQILFQ
jgi:serine/threonine-protein kinase